MLKAALESLKRRSGDNTQLQPQPQYSKLNVDNEKCSPISSQLSALLFSSPLNPTKQAKLAVEDEFGSFMEDDGDDLEELLLKELEECDNIIDLIDNNIDKDIDKNVDKDIDNALSDNALSDNALSDNVLSDNDEMISKSISTTLAFIPENNEECSVLDSLYNTMDERGLPMIDFSTPKTSQSNRNCSQNVLIGELIYSQNEPGSQIQNNLVKRIMIPGNFNLIDLQFNIKSIASNLSLNPIESINQSTHKRIPFPLALMLRDYKQIGPTAQLRLLDGHGNEITASMLFSACEKEMKLSYGLIMILNEVTVMKSPRGIKYLHIIKRNIKEYYNNMKLIE